MAPVREPAIIKYMNDVIEKTDIGSHFNDAATLESLWKKFIQPQFDSITCSPLLQQDSHLYQQFSDLYHAAEEYD